MMLHDGDDDDGGGGGDADGYDDDNDDSASFISRYRLNVLVHARLLIQPMPSQADSVALRCLSNGIFRG